MKSRRKPPSRKQIEDMISFGPYPKNYRSRIKEFFRNKGSGSSFAVYQLGSPHRAYVSLGGSLGPTTLGYVVDAKIKVMDRSGKYGKEQPYTFFLKNDSIRPIEPFRVKGHP